MNGFVIRIAETLSVGTELLIGDIVNTDTAYIARGLASVGICQYRQSVVGDNAERLYDALTNALERSDLVILTGGLGPTYDDITKEIACKALDKKLYLDSGSLDRLKSYFERNRRVMTENNIKQSYFPEGAYIFSNRFGTADGCAVMNRDGTKMIVMLPGPPKELEPMFSDQVMPYITRFTENVIVSHNINICGKGESEVEMLLRERMLNAVNPTEAPYCQDGEVRIRVTASAKTKDEAERLCADDIEEIKRTEIGKYIYGTDTTLENTVVNELKARGLTLFTAESCTGGLVCKKITDVPGASDVLLGGVVSYVNDIKKGLLGVSEETIEKYTEVSEQCASEMAVGARKLSGCDISVSVTGYASAGSGVPSDKVGLVYTSLSDKYGTVTFELHFGGTRAHVRDCAVKQILNMILTRLKDKYGRN